MTYRTLRIRGPTSLVRTDLQICGEGSMARLTASICFFILATLAAGRAQAPPVPGQQQYLLIDAQSSRSRLTRTVNLSKVRERLVDAVEKGYGVHFVAGLSSSANLLLKRGDAGKSSYRMVATSSENGFLKELNEAASQGFKVVPGGIKALEEGGALGNQTTWMAVLRKQPDTSRNAYSVVKGTKDGEEALASSTTSGLTLVGILGRQGMVSANTLLFFEKSDQPTAPPASEHRDYRIVATARTSAMQNDLSQAAADGFRLIGAGFGYMTVVMARERGSAPAPIEYRLLAVTRLETGVRELQAAGAEGFRVAAMSENGQEGVFILHRTPGTPGRFDYRVIPLQESTVNQALIDAEADGYKIITLLSDLVVLERQ
jgi:hypothetical protein